MSRESAKSIFWGSGGRGVVVGEIKMSSADILPACLALIYKQISIPKF